jgi:hypothetical protein
MLKIGLFLSKIIKKIYTQKLPSQYNFSINAEQSASLPEQQTWQHSRVKAFKPVPRLDQPPPDRGKTMGLRAMPIEFTPGNLYNAKSLVGWEKKFCRANKTK